MSKIYWRHENSGALTAVWPDNDEWTFSRPGKSYIYCDFGKATRSGTLGTQITYSNGFTCYADTQEEFEKTVKEWMLRYLRKLETPK